MRQINPSFYESLTYGRIDGPTNGFSTIGVEPESEIKNENKMNIKDCQKLSKINKETRLMIN